MTMWLALALAVAVGSPGGVGIAVGGPNSMRIEQDGVRIDASLHAQLYSWTITNISAEPIMRVSMPQHGTYSQQIPPGWEMEFEDRVFTAWTDDERYAIRAGQSRTFTARGATVGANLGTADVSLGFSQGGNDVHIAGVWAPVPRRVSLVFVVVAMLIAIALAHTAIVWKRAGRSDRQ